MSAVAPHDQQWLMNGFLLEVSFKWTHFLSWRSGEHGKSGLILESINQSINQSIIASIKGQMTEKSDIFFVELNVFIKYKINIFWSYKRIGGHCEGIEMLK